MNKDDILMEEDYKIIMLSIITGRKKEGIEEDELIKLTLKAADEIRKTVLSNILWEQVKKGKLIISNVDKDGEIIYKLAEDIP